ncbi:disease resistance-like protein DSC2 [Medicago truncatula]|nr:disease resistance-like protein DSC2 [Medicago truncatula]
MMPNLSKIYATDCRLLLPKHKDILSSTVASNVEDLILSNNNLSDECVRAVLTLCANVKYLYLSDNNIKVIPECLNECHHLSCLRLEDCKSLEEIRGFPPNLKRFSAMRCESLTSSCRRMLLSQKLLEAGCIEICLPTGTEGIPDCFEHQSWGHTVSFWFRKEIPSISSVILFSDPKVPFVFGDDDGDTELRVKLCAMAMNILFHAIGG